MDGIFIRSIFGDILLPFIGFVLEFEDMLPQIVIIVTKHPNQGGIGGFWTEMLPGSRFVCEHSDKRINLVMGLVGNLFESAFGRGCWKGRSEREVLVWPALYSGCL